MIGLSSFLSLWELGKAPLAIDVCGVSNLGTAIRLDLLSNIGRIFSVVELEFITEIGFSHSCKLAVRWVAPDYLPFEPKDTKIFDRDTYRDYQVASRRPKLQGQSDTSDTSAAPFFVRHDDRLLPSIDLVCHRLTMKWEPIFNIVYRYVFCRCIIRLSTPSRLVEEMTILLAWVCPRHNTQGVAFRDYSELALSCVEDPYFDRFGGYYAFWALLHRYLPKLYHHIGGLKAITDSELEYGYVGLRRMKEDDNDSIQNIVNDFWFEVVEYMVKKEVDLPPDVVADFTKEKTKRTQAVEKTDFSSSIEETDNSRFMDEFNKSSMGRELTEIARGKWNGVPHWTIEDWMKETVQQRTRGIGRLSTGMKLCTRLEVARARLVFAASCGMCQPLSPLIICAGDEKKGDISFVLYAVVDTSTYLKSNLQRLQNLYPSLTPSYLDTVPPDRPSFKIYCALASLGRSLRVFHFFVPPLRQPSPVLPDLLCFVLHLL